MTSSPALACKMTDSTSRARRLLDELIARAGEVTYDQVVRAIDSTPAGRHEWLIAVNEYGESLVPAVLSRLVQHRDWARLRTVWTRNENERPAINGWYIHLFLDAVDATEDRQTRVEAIDFLLAEVVERRRFTRYVLVDDVRDLNDWFDENVPLSMVPSVMYRWRESAMYGRVEDLLLADDYTRYCMHSSQRLRNAFITHVTKNRIRPAMLDVFRSAQRTTRLHFLYRGQRTEHVDITAPVSTTWSLKVAQHYAQLFIAVIRVPVGTPIVTVVYDDNELVDYEAEDKEVILPSFGRLHRVQTSREAQRFVTQWYTYRCASEVFFETELRHKLRFYDYELLELGLPRRLLEVADDGPLMSRWDDADLADMHISP